MYILIVSSSKRNNYKLAKKIGSLLSSDFKIISLEDYKLPLYISGNEDVSNDIISNLIKEFKNSIGVIFCIPEYNYNCPPILTNAITWISVKSDNWRDAFSEKKILLASHSGGPAFNFFNAFRNQLLNLGSIVYPRVISVHKTSKFNSESVKKILASFQKFL